MSKKKIEREIKLHTNKTLIHNTLISKGSNLNLDKVNHKNSQIYQNNILLINKTRVKKEQSIKDIPSPNRLNLNYFYQNNPPQKISNISGLSNLTNMTNMTNVSRKQRRLSYVKKSSY